MASRGQRRRQVARRRAAALAVLVVAGVAIALGVGLSNGGGSKPETTTRAAPPPPPPPPRRHKKKAKTNRVSAARADAAITRLARFGLPLYCGGPKGRYLALTFDDGPGPATQRNVLPMLRRAHARATFFVIGQNIAGYPKVAREEAALGEVGDHTWTHAKLTALSAGGVSSELARTKEAIRSATGRAPILFRPPYGARNSTVDQTARSLGMLEVLWSIDSYDARGARTWQEVAHNVLKNVQPGSIVLMHENLPTTVKALPQILRVLVHRKFQLVTLGELLARDPPSTARLRGGLEACYTAR